MELYHTHIELHEVNLVHLMREEAIESIGEYGGIHPHFHLPQETASEFQERLHLQKYWCRTNVSLRVRNSSVFLIIKPLNKPLFCDDHRKNWQCLPTLQGNVMDIQG